MKLVVGTANLSKIYSLNQKTIKKKNEAINQINLSIGCGIDFFDTAPNYAYSEEYLGHIKKKIKIITKISKIKKEAIKESMINSVNKSLKKLNRNNIDCLIIHDIEFFKKNNSKIIFDELKKFKKNKLCKKIGFSVYSPSDIDFIMKFGKPDVIQIPFNIFDRRFKQLNILKKLKKKNIEIHARSIFLRGFLLMNNNELPVHLSSYKEVHLKFEKWCNANKISKLETCLNYVKSNKEINKIIVGIDNIENLKEIIKHFKKKVLKFPKYIFSNDINLLDIRKWKK